VVSICARPSAHIVSRPARARVEPAQSSSTSSAWRGPDLHRDRSDTRQEVHVRSGGCGSLAQPHEMRAASYQSPVSESRRG